MLDTLSTPEEDKIRENHGMKDDVKKILKFDCILRNF